MQRAGSRLVQRLLASGHTVVAFCYPPELGNAELMAAVQVGRQQAARAPPGGHPLWRVQVALPAGAWPWHSGSMMTGLAAPANLLALPRPQRGAGAALRCASLVAVRQCRCP